MQPRLPPVAGLARRCRPAAGRVSLRGLAASPWPGPRRHLSAASALAQALRALGRYAEASDLDRHILESDRRRHGADHPHTLASAGNLAGDLHALGDYQAARQLHEDTLNRYRRLAGDDHPETLAAATSLATVLRALGEDAG